MEKEAPKLTSENTELDWTAPLERIANQVRGLSPYPGAWSVFENKGKQERFKIFKAKVFRVKHKYPPKKIVIQEDQLLITHAEGYLICLEIQLPNKKRMPAKALLNGYHFAADAFIL
jgi:methionyl-tRNA formyltransferase